MGAFRTLYNVCSLLRAQCSSIAYSSSKIPPQESGAEAGAQLLANHNLTEIAIDYAVEHNNFDHAFELARIAGMKPVEIHLKKALYGCYSFCLVF